MVLTKISNDEASKASRIFAFSETDPDKWIDLLSMAIYINENDMWLRLGTEGAYNDAAFDTPRIAPDPDSTIPFIMQRETLSLDRPFAEKDRTGYLPMANFATVIDNLSVWVFDYDNGRKYDMLVEKSAFSPEVWEMLSSEEHDNYQDIGVIYRHIAKRAWLGAQKRGYDVSEENVQKMVYDSLTDSQKLALSLTGEDAISFFDFND